METSRANAGWHKCCTTGLSFKSSLRVERCYCTNFTEISQSMPKVMSDVLDILTLTCNSIQYILYGHSGTVQYVGIWDYTYVSKYSGYPFFCNIVCQHYLNKVSNPWFQWHNVKNEFYKCVKTLRQFLVSKLFSVLQSYILIF